MYLSPGWKRPLLVVAGLAAAFAIQYGLASSSQALDAGPSDSAAMSISGSAESGSAESGTVDAYGAYLQARGAAAKPPTPAQVKACVDQGMRMSRQLRTTVEIRGTAEDRGVPETIARIRAVSGDCMKQLFADGTAAHPNAGYLTGDGFSFTARTCPGATPCRGGDAGALTGNGGNGFNSGQGGRPGWYGGIAGNGGDGAIDLSLIHI